MQNDDNSEKYFKNLHKELVEFLRYRYNLVYDSEVDTYTKFRTDIRCNNLVYSLIYFNFEIFDNDEELMDLHDDEYWLFKNQMVHDPEYRGSVIYNTYCKRGQELCDESVLEIGLGYSDMTDYDIHTYFVGIFFYKMLAAFIIKNVHYFVIEGIIQDDDNFDIYLGQQEIKNIS